MSALLRTRSTLKFKPMFSFRSVIQNPSIFEANSGFQSLNLSYPTLSRSSTDSIKTMKEFLSQSSKSCGRPGLSWNFWNDRGTLFDQGSLMRTFFLKCAELLECHFQNHLNSPRFSFLAVSGVNINFETVTMVTWTSSCWWCDALTEWAASIHLCLFF